MKEIYQKICRMIDESYDRREFYTCCALCELKAKMELLFPSGEFPDSTG